VATSKGEEGEIGQRMGREEGGGERRGKGRRGKGRGRKRRAHDPLAWGSPMS